jgi:hypothetical protein
MRYPRLSSASASNVAFQSNRAPSASGHSSSWFRAQCHKRCFRQYCLSACCVLYAACPPCSPRLSCFAPSFFSNMGLSSDVASAKLSKGKEVRLPPSLCDVSLRGLAVVWPWVVCVPLHPSFGGSFCGSCCQVPHSPLSPVPVHGRRVPVVLQFQLCHECSSPSVRGALPLQLCHECSSAKCCSRSSSAAMHSSHSHRCWAAL